MPKSVPRLVLDKVRQVLVSVVLNSNVLVLIVPNKSISQELNNVLFCSCCCKDEQMYYACNIVILLIEWMLPF